MDAWVEEDKSLFYDKTLPPQVGGPPLKGSKRGSFKRLQ